MFSFRLQLLSKTEERMGNARYEGKVQLIAEGRNAGKDSRPGLLCRSTRAVPMHRLHALVTVGLMPSFSSGFTLELQEPSNKPGTCARSHSRPGKDTTNRGLFC